MSRELEINKISKDDFLKINEDVVMFITNPGRMGDEDGSTFIIKKDDIFKIYRLSEWMYRSKDFDENEHISLDDALKQFSKYPEALKLENIKCVFCDDKGEDDEEALERSLAFRGEGATIALAKNDIKKVLAHVNNEQIGGLL